MAYVITEVRVDTKDASCVEVCPVTAIYRNDEVPAEYHAAIKSNADHYLGGN